MVNEHPSVVESAVVGHMDEIRGECPIAFVILKGNSETLSKEELDKLSIAINAKVRTDIGPIARLEAVFYVQKLPKTRLNNLVI